MTNSLEKKKTKQFIDQIMMKESLIITIVKIITTLTIKLMKFREQFATNV